MTSRSRCVNDSYRPRSSARSARVHLYRRLTSSGTLVLRAPTSELEPFSSHRDPTSPISGLAQVEREHILLALEASNWVIAGRNGAAERLGMKRTSLVYRMKKLRIIRPAAVPQKRSARGAAGDD